MKLKLCTTALCLLPMAAHATSGFYAGASARRVLLDDPGLTHNNMSDGKALYEDGEGVSLNLGYGLPGTSYRMEGELLYNHNRFSGVTSETSTFAAEGGEGNMESVAGLANVLVDIPLSDRISPYIGGGLGMAYNTAGTLSDTVMAYQFLTGLNLTNEHGSALYAGYRYYKTGDLENNNWVIPYQSQNVEVGFRYAFAKPDTVYPKKEEKTASVVEDTKGMSTRFTPLADQPDERLENVEAKDTSRVPLREITSQEKTSDITTAPKAPEPGRVLPDSSTQRYYVQVASFQRRDNASKLEYQLRDVGKPFIEEVKTQGGQAVYRVFVGSTRKEDIARKVLARVQDMGYDTAFITLR